MNESFASHDSMAWGELPMTGTPTLGVVMPIYNESEWIDEIVRRVLARYEVQQLVAVDDGSADRSWEKLARWVNTDARFLAVRHAKNRGKGAAIRTGLAKLKTDLILIQDADLEYSPDDYPKLLAPIVSGQAAVVYGSRFATGNAVNPAWHTFCNGLLTSATNLLTGLALTDEATCYKLFKRDVLDRIQLEEDRFGFCPEVTAKLARLGISIIEVPITYSGRNWKQGKKLRLRDGFDAIRCLLKYSR